MVSAGEPTEPEDGDFRLFGVALYVEFNPFNQHADNLLPVLWRCGG